MSVPARTATLVAVVVPLLLVAVAAVVVVVVRTGDAGTSGGSSGAPEPVPGGAGGATRSASGAAPASPGTAQAPTSRGSSAPAPSGQPAPTGPAGEAASPSNGAGPGEQPRADEKSEPLLGEAPDGTESANGRIVGSFPEALRPGPGGRVVSSSVAPYGRRVQASLVVRDRAAARQVLRRYHLRLAVHGFTELPVRSVPGSTGAVFRKGPESVVVTVTGGRQPSYSVVASLVAG
jgi:hypothetical protein